MKPLHLLRGLYRQLKTPVMHVSKESHIQKRNVDVTFAADTATATTTSSSIPHSSKSRSNASTRFLMEQYRAAVSLLSLQQQQAPHNTTTNEAVHPNTTTNQQQQHIQWWQRRFATEIYLLRQDIHQRGELYMIDTGADQQLSPHEFSRRAAARAGLQLPEPYKD
jgi:hypothetical protein